MFKYSKKAMTLLFVMLTVAAWSLQVAAQEAASANEDGQTKVKAKAKNPLVTKKGAPKNNNPTLNNLTGGASGWRLQGSMTHNPKLRKDQEDTTDILLRADYAINKKHTIRVQQFFSKFYGKYESEYEFKPFDTSVAHFYRLGYKPFGMNLQWRNQVSLPISNESNRDDLFTVFQTSVVASKALFGGKALAFAVPYARYFAYEYKTSESGRLLPWYQAGASLGALYFFTSKLAFYGGMDYRFDTVRNSQFDQTPSQVPRGNYRFDLDLSYQATQHWTGSVSYSQGDSYIQNGRYEVVVFDDQESRIGLGVTYIY